MKYVNKLREIRESLNLTTSDVAQVAGVYQSTISKIENGKRRLDVDTLEKILKVFNMTLSEFFNEDVEIDSNDDSMSDMWVKLLQHKDLQDECDYNYYALTEEEKEKLKSNLVFALKISLNLIKDKK